MHTASRFRSRVTASRDGRVMDGKSILGILLLAASQGHRDRGADRRATDEEAAMVALCALVEGGFGEDA